MFHPHPLSRVKPWVSSSASFSKEPAQLPKTFGATINSFPVQANPERLRQSTKSFAARTTRQPDPDEKRKKADFLRESRMKLDETWHIPIGLRALGETTASLWQLNYFTSTLSVVISSGRTIFYNIWHHYNTRQRSTAATTSTSQHVRRWRWATSSSAQIFSSSLPPQYIWYRYWCRRDSILWNRCSILNLNVKSSTPLHKCFISVMP